MTPNCETVILQNYVNELVTGNLLKLYNKSLRFPADVTTNPNYRYCPKPDCGFPVLHSENSPSKKLVCTEIGCETEFCFDCRSFWHDGLSCEKNTEVKDAFGEWVKKNNAQQCPRCGVFGQRIEGCDYIQCPSCKFEYCWMCLDPHDHNIGSHVHGKNYNPNIEYYNYDDDVPRVAYNRAQLRRRRRRAPGVLIACGVILLVPCVLVAAVVVGVPYVCIKAGKKTVVECVKAGKHTKRSFDEKFFRHDWQKNYQQLHRETR
jgi:hypothetical protein